MGKEKPMSFMGQGDLPNCGYSNNETSLYAFFTLWLMSIKILSNHTNQMV
tara:strand:+ start:92 stop:241 length:150 start_codon:yes stop_codon:yes gene_type:complete